MRARNWEMMIRIRRANGIGLEVPWRIAPAER